jgi:hypothetical protein
MFRSGDRAGRGLTMARCSEGVDRITRSCRGYPRRFASRPILSLIYYAISLHCYLAKRIEQKRLLEEMLCTRCSNIVSNFTDPNTDNQRRVLSSTILNAKRNANATS